jgi:DNA-binding transcriptional ArsR family regulator
MSQPAVSKHLKVLENAGLVSRSQLAQSRPRRLEAKPLKEATMWLENYKQFWEASFGRLDDLLEEMKLEPRARKGESLDQSTTKRRKKNGKQD